MPDMVFPADDTPFADDVAFAAGISLAVDAATVFESAASASCFRRQVFDLAAAGLPLSVSLASLSPDARHPAEVEFILELVAGAMHDAGMAAHDLALVTEAPSIAPRVAWQLRRRYLGAGPVYVRPAQQAMSESCWREVFELRAAGQLGLLCVPFVLSPCRLLPAELAVGLVPPQGIQGPAGSAWVTLPVDVADLASPRGEIDEYALDSAVRDAVADGEALHSRACWPTARLRHDAWLNRRLALEVRGIGALVKRRGLDPAEFAALNEMSRLVRRIREMAVAESRRMAARVGHVPALEQADLANSLPGGRIRDGWAERWQRAVEASAVRHRNLLVMSPWSLFPPGETDFRYVNLLPLLRFADTCVFGKPPDLGDWKFNQFKGFYQQAAAVLQQRNAAHQIAV